VNISLRNVAELSSAQVTCQPGLKNCPFIHESINHNAEIAQMKAIPLVRASALLRFTNFLDQIGAPTERWLEQSNLSGALLTTPDLTKADLSYSHLVEQVRFNLAISWLQDPSLKIADIAAELGYNDPANFTRAFKRWTGVSPLRFRQQQQEPQG
jgi:AraC-like DNA-binding protein